MAIYVYESADGDTVEVERSMKNPPDWGHKIRRNGKTYTRQFPRTAPPMVRRNCHIMARSLPRWDPSHKGEFTKNGVPLMDKWSEVKEYTARASDNDRVIVDYD